MEYTLDLFVSKLKEWFINSALFPYYEIANNTETQYGKRKQQSDAEKHQDRHPTHLKDVAKQCIETSTTSSSENIIEFNYGNNVMETNYPYYHILEDSQIIRKRNKGTKKTKGSQMYEKIKANKDYGIVYWNGKTFTKEYEKNVRGSRNRMSNVSHWGLENLQSKWQNSSSNAYWNTHYKYIEDILDNDVILRLTSYFGMKVSRKQDTGLIDEFAYQEDAEVDTVLQAFGNLL